MNYAFTIDCLPICLQFGELLLLLLRWKHCYGHCYFKHQILEQNILFYSNKYYIIKQDYKYFTCYFRVSTILSKILYLMHIMFRNRWFFSKLSSFYTVPQGFIVPFPSYSVQCRFLIQFSISTITWDEWMPSLALKLHFHSPTPKVFKCADFTPAYSSKPLGRGLGYSFLLIN